MWNGIPGVKLAKTNMINSQNNASETAIGASPRSDAQGSRLPPVRSVQGLPGQGRARLKKQVQKIRVCSLNVGTMTGKGGEIRQMMERRRITILCVQETRWKGNKARELGGGCRILYSGANRNGRNGVGIVLAKEVRDEVIEVNRRSDRVMRVKLNVGETVNILCVYAPQVGCEEEEKENFWRDLEEEFRLIPNGERVVLGGDLNGHVGRERAVIERVHGGWGMGEMNEEGERIIDFALAFDLAICNTFFQKRHDHYVTFRSGGRVSQIDFILVRRRHLKECVNCKVIYGEHVSTQHKLVVLDWELECGKKRRLVRRIPRVKWWKLKEEHLKQEFKIRVMERIRMEEEAQEWWTWNSEVLRKAGEEVFGVTSGRGPPPDKESWWWNEEVQKIVKEKNELKKRWELSGLQEDRRRFRVANKRSKKGVARAKAAALDEWYKELDTPEGETKIHKIAKARDKATKDLTHIKQVKDENGEVLKEEEQIRKRWEKYFKKLLNEENPRTVFGDGVPNQALTPGISRLEVEKALKKMKNSKATGPDNIPVEAWKGLGEEGIDLLWDLMKKVYQQEKMPEEWRDSIIIPIYKEKGDIQECGNYRGIKLLSHTMKVWERIIERRIRDETTIGEEQFGFMPGRSTTDAIFALRQLLEKHRERGKGVHVVFIDLEKAYDRVPRQELWRCMREKRVPEKYVRIVQDMYESARTRIRSSVGETEGIQVKVGLHQGSSLSPYLFDLIMDVLAMGVREESPWCMLFADDIALCSTSKEEVERKTENWRRALEERGLKISRKKTEYMKFCDERDLEVRLQGELLKRVDKFKYLGSTVAHDGELDAEISHRIQSGWRNWKSMSGVLCDKRMSMKVKGKIYKTVVRPAMVYGAETWATKKTQEEKLNVVEMKMLRWACGVTRMDRVRNERIRGTIKVTEISKKIQERRLQWYGHVMRREDDYVGKRVMGMEIEGRRGRGRPKRRWMDSVRADLTEKGLEGDEYEDRAEWRRLVRNADPA